MAKIILGLAGEMGSGKGTIAKYVVEKYNGSSHRFSTVLRDILDRLHLEQSRTNFAKLSLILREHFGEDILASVIFHDTKDDANAIVAIDGIRRHEDIVHLRKLPHFKLVYVEANLEKCYERVVHRGENTDDLKKTFDEFRRDHALETELGIKELKEASDFVITNNSTLEDLYQQVDDIIQKL